MQTIRQQMNIVIAGHVDHGKSTVIGRLLHDTNSLPQGKIEQIRAFCEANSRPFEYAFLLDALKDERAQGITIDSARVFFKTQSRDYIIIDAPGHIEFLKNMVSGASRAEAALLVIDADEGVQENSRRHGFMLSMLGIKQIAILVNKMDLVKYNHEKFEEIVNNYKNFLSQTDIHVDVFVPVSGREGDNIATLSENMTWYTGKTVLQVLDDFAKEKAAIDKPFRMMVQDVYKFTQKGDSRRIIAGTIDSGSVSVGDEVIFYPSGKKSRVKTIEIFNKEPQQKVSAGMAVGFTLEEQLYIVRGELATKAQNPPCCTSRLLVSLFWLGREPLVKKKNYIFKIGTQRCMAKIEEVTKTINASNLSVSKTKDSIERHEVAECILQLNKAIAFDKTEDIAETSRFVLVDDYEISGGGIIRQDLKDKQSSMRDKVLTRNYKWEKSIISREQRATQYNQKSNLIIITGNRNVGKKKLAKELESRLFAEGKFVYFLGIGNVLYGVDADIKGQENSREEHLRRLAEVAHIFLDAGAILVVTAVELTQEDLEIIKISVHVEQIETIWVGEDVTTDIVYDMKVPIMSSDEITKEYVFKIKNSLQERGVIFCPW